MNELVALPGMTDGVRVFSFCTPVVVTDSFLLVSIPAGKFAFLAQRADSGESLDLSISYRSLIGL